VAPALLAGPVSRASAACPVMHLAERAFVWGRYLTGSVTALPALSALSATFATASDAPGVHQCLG
jgi:hypothetical protein